jgi:transposase
MHSIKNTNFKSLISKEKNARMRVRLMALSHIQDNANRAQTAKFLKVSRGSVNKWVQDFINDGIDGLKEKPRSGRPSALSELQLLQLKEYVINNSIKPTGGCLKGSVLVDYINHEFGVLYSLDNIYRLLHKLGFSWITSRSKHPKQDLNAQECFKKSLKLK